MTSYIGIIDGNQTVWGLRFPDLPGCYGGGVSQDDTIIEATSSLREYATHMAGINQNLPTPRSITELNAAGEIAEGEVAVLIPLFLDAGRTVRANITLDAGLLEIIDTEANLRGLTRSAFLASAAREKIEMRR